MTTDYEAMVESVYRSLLQPGMGAIDVGAHAGRHALPILELVAPTGRAILVKPLPELRSGLQAVLDGRPELRAMTELHGCALADETGDTEFCVAVDAPGFSSIRERVYDVPTRVERIQVPLRRLDDLAAPMKRVDYIKIDTEGAEWKVLRGGAETIRRCRPVITFEFGANSYRAFDVDPADVHRFFHGLSYKVLDIRGRELGEAEFCRSAEHQQVWDYVAVPGEQGDRFAFLRSAT